MSADITTLGSGEKFPVVKRLRAFLFLFRSTLAWFTPLAANPVITGDSSLSPATLGGGDVATFTFSFANADTPESAAMTGSLLEIGWGLVMINGVANRFEILGVNAAGGSVGFEFDGSGRISGLTVAYGAVAKGASRIVTVTLQVPNAGLVNASTLQCNAMLTWPQAPGMLARSSIATLQASPSLHLSLAPVPPFTAPGGEINYRIGYQNEGTGITRRAWVVVPVNTNAELIRVAAGASARPAAWFSTSVYPLEQVSSHSFISAHFQPGIVSENGSPEDPSDDFWLIPPNTRMMAFLLDDPELDLFPAGAGYQELEWQVRDDGSAPGALITQGFGFFSDEVPFTTGETRTTTIRSLPADLAIYTSENFVELTFTGEAGRQYVVERSGDLDEWLDAGVAIQSSNPGFFFFLDSDPLPGRGFYRLVWIPDP